MSCQGCGGRVISEYPVLVCGKKCRAKAGLQGLVDRLQCCFSTHCLVEVRGVMTLRSKTWAENPQISPDVATFLRGLKPTELGFLVCSGRGYMMTKVGVKEHHPNPSSSNFYNAHLLM